MIIYLKNLYNWIVNYLVGARISHLKFYYFCNKINNGIKNANVFPDPVGAIAIHDFY